MLTIGNFWRERLPETDYAADELVVGWQAGLEGLPTFHEAPLTPSADEYLAGDHRTASVILVSAPGAVGKSTLAKQIAHETGAIYVDLAKADPVGGNSISGGIFRASLPWKDSATAVLIDGLDEARLRVNQASFDAFLSDVAAVSKGRNVPTVLFGRTGSVQDAWLTLSDHTDSISVLEIGFYDTDQSIAFAEGVLSSQLPDDPHSGPRKRALSLTLQGLRSQTEGDGDRFAGYAPVLTAVATRLVREQNPSALISSIEARDEAITLKDIVKSILERERGKLSSLAFEDATLHERAYSVADQMQHLAARVYNAESPPPPGGMSPIDSATYADALATWVDEHPFLNGARAPSSAVFEAAIAAHALMGAGTKSSALSREIEKGAAANPFLPEFYPQKPGAIIPPEHVGVIYNSLRARLSLGDSASLAVEGPEDDSDNNPLVAHIEIAMQRRNADRAQIIEFEAVGGGPLVLGKHLEDVEVAAPLARVDIGPGDEVIFVTPVMIQCRDLSLTAERLIVETPQGDVETGAAFLQAEFFDGSLLSSVPLLRGGASLAVAWPTSSAHPWTAFSTSPTEQEDPLVREGLRRLRKFVVAFRSHSKGSLKRYRDKIEHARMTKGVGQAVLDQLVHDEVLSLDGSMYTLDSQRLGSIVGTTYADAMSFSFGATTVAYIQSAVT